jgi:hypothetical protein
MGVVRRRPGTGEAGEAGEEAMEAGEGDEICTDIYIHIYIYT